MRRSRLLFVMLLLVVCAALIDGRALANWYAGTWNAASYGVWAGISTPATAPYMESVPSSWQYNWVSIPGPNWIQSGWSLGATYGTPRSYVETCINGCYGPPARFFQEYSDHPFGSTIDYKVGHSRDTSDIWCAYIDNIQKYCQAVTQPPQQVQVFSEIVASSKNYLDTTFSSVWYEDSSYVWHAFDSSDTLTGNCPYVAFGQPNNFHTTRGACVYLPAVLR